MVRFIKKIKIKSHYLLAFCFLITLAFFGIHNLCTLLQTKAPIDTNDISVAIDNLEKDYNDNFYMKYYFVNANGFAHKLMGQQLMKDVVKLNNGSLTKTIKENLCSQYSENMIELNNHLSKKDIPLLYVQAPYKICKLDNQLPAGVVDFSNDNADYVLSLLQNGGVNTLDLRKEIHKDGLDHDALFFKTDLHWTIETSFWAFGKIADLMNDQLNFDIDAKYTDITNYNAETYEDWFLGYWGKITGSKFAGVDDISLLTPKFNTDMSLSIPSKDIVRKGSFSDAIFDMERIDPQDYFNKAPYEVYLGGQYPLTVIKNEQQENGKKALVVLDSFGRPVASFMSLCFSEVDIIDLRKFTDDTLIQYIDKTEPDVVMFLYNPSALNSTFFKFS